MQLILLSWHQMALCCPCVAVSDSRYSQGPMNLDPIDLRDLVKLKKSKNPRKTLIVQITPTHPLYNFFFGNMYNKKKHYKKHNISPPPKKKKSELRLDPPTHFLVFLGFFLTWQNPLVLLATVWLAVVFTRRCISRQNKCYLHPPTCDKMQSKWKLHGHPLSSADTRMQVLNMSTFRHQ